MKKSIKSRAITYARRYPGQSATQIAHAVGAHPATVSHELYQAVKRGMLVRTDGGGPAGGHTYGPVLK